LHRARRMLADQLVGSGLINNEGEAIRSNPASKGKK
jgi:hypothetical protein